MGNFFIGILQELTWLLDKAVYSLVKTAYSVFYYLANATILDSDVVSRFTLRMYMILSVVMVFVLAFNLLQYIIDPDKVNDKKVGASAFIKDVIIALVIIIMCPTIFSKLYSLQATVISSGVIPNLILGGIAEDSTDTITGFEENKSEYKSLPDYAITHGADSMIADVYVAFLYPADSTVTALDCGTDRASGYEDYCEAYKRVKATGSLDEFKDFYKNDKYNYTPFMTTIAGIVLFYFILSFCLNLGKRVGKMALLQLVAPIPVTLELVPSKKGLRKNWIDTLIKVYIEVFFFLLAIFFIIFLISLIPSTVRALLANLTTEGWGMVGLFTTLFLIFGLLSFGKEAPQMFFDLVGIKSTGIIKEAAIRGYRMAGAVTAGAGAGLTSTIRGWNSGSNVVNRISGALSAGVTGTARGMWVNRTGGFRGISSRTAQAVNTTMTRHSRRINAINAHGGGIRGRIAATTDGLSTSAGRAIGNVRNWATGEGSYSRQNDRINAMTAARGYFTDPTRGFAPLDNLNNVLNNARVSTGYNGVLSAFRNQYGATRTEDEFREHLENNNNIYRDYDYQSARNDWQSQNEQIRLQNEQIRAQNQENIRNGNTNNLQAEISEISWEDYQRDHNYRDYDMSDYVNALSERNRVQDERINNRRQDLISNARRMMEYISVHPEIELSSEASADLENLRNALFDSNGNIRADVADSSLDTNNTQIKALHKALKDINNRMEADIRTANDDIASRRMREEARRNGGSNNGGNSGGGGH